MKDKKFKFEVKDPHTLGGESYILSLYINSTKDVVIHFEVELYKPLRYISLPVDVCHSYTHTLCECMSEYHRDG